MKSSNEMYESLLTRREEYVNARRKRGKGIALIAVCMTVFALVGVGTWHIIRSDMKKESAEKTALTENAQQTTAQQQDDVSTADKLPVNAMVDEPANSETTFIDQIGTIIKDGREYRQIFSGNNDSYTKKECIGRASEFDGTYSGTPDVDGDVYTVNEADDVLMINLDNGGIVYLKCED